MGVLKGVTGGAQIRTREYRALSIQVWRVCSKAGLVLDDAVFFLNTQEHPP
jgi:hypothetical protein